MHQRQAHYQLKVCHYLGVAKEGREVKAVVLNYAQFWECTNKDYLTKVSVLTRWYVQRNKNLICSFVDFLRHFLTILKAIELFVHYCISSGWILIPIALTYVVLLNCMWLNRFNNRIALRFMLHYKWLDTFSNIIDLRFFAALQVVESFVQ